MSPKRDAAPAQAAQQEGEDANGAKRSRTQLAMPNGVVKQELRVLGGEEPGQGVQGVGALVAAVVQAVEEPQIIFQMAACRLNCHACLQPLKPPTFKCEVGHVVCDACRDSHSHACIAAGTYVPCTPLDEIMRDAKVPCANDKYGCTSWVTYNNPLEHHISCRFAPCFCPVAGCGHSTSPARLADHFSVHHAWTVTKVDYAKPRTVAVPGPQDMLVLVGNADGSVFLMCPSAYGPATAMSLVCVRACGDAAAGAPQYECKLWAQVPGKKENAMLTFVVASSNLTGGFAAIDQAMFMAVPPALLHDESGEPAQLAVRIDKVGVAVASARSRSPSTTTPSSSSLPVMRIGN